MMISEIYKTRYAEYCENRYGYTRYEWAASEIFDLTTYDGELDELFAKKIIEVLKVIINKTNFEYIKDNTNYINYILVCQLLNKFNWIEWGTSIRGAWIETYHPNVKTHPILEEYTVTRYVDGKWEDSVYPEVRCTEENLRALIEFIETEDEPSDREET